MIIETKVNQTVKKSLETFFNNHFDGYCAFGYETVQNIVEDINNGNMESKPIYNFIIIGDNDGAETSINNDAKGYKIFMEFAIYSSIDSNYKENFSRSYVLDQITDELRDTFDTYKSELPFKRIKFNPATSPNLGENADGLYSMEHTLSFWFVKEI